MHNAALLIEQVRALAAQLSPVERLAMISAIAATDSASTQPGQAEPESGLQRIIAEEKAWYAQPKTKRMIYAGEYVALHDGQVVDHDVDQDLLDRRVFQKWGDSAVLIVFANWDDAPEYAVLSPRLDH